MAIRALFTCAALAQEVIRAMRAKIVITANTAPKEAERTRSCTRTTHHASQGIQARIVTKADRAAPRCSTQRAGISPPHAEGDGLSGVTSERESNAFISVPAAFVGGVPLTRAMNPWAMPEAST